MAAEAKAASRWAKQELALLQLVKTESAASDSSTLAVAAREGSSTPSQATVARHRSPLEAAASVGSFTLLAFVTAKKAPAAVALDASAGKGPVLRSLVEGLPRFDGLAWEPLKLKLPANKL